MQFPEVRTVRYEHSRSSSACTVARLRPAFAAVSSRSPPGKRRLRSSCTNSKREAAAESIPAPFFTSDACRFPPPLWDCTLLELHPSGCALLWSYEIALAGLIDNAASRLRRSCRLARGTMAGS